VGLVSIGAGYAYTGGPFPLAYHGLGDLFVLLFFGEVAVSGTYYVQAQSVSQACLWCGLAVGAFGVALLSVNNIRDEITDRAANKRTLVVRFGRRFGQWEFVLMALIGFLIPGILFGLGLSSKAVFLALLPLPLVLRPLKIVWNAKGALLNQALGQTAQLQLIFGALFSFGLAQ